MKVTFEITDEEISRSNNIGSEYLNSGDTFPVDLYYEGYVILEDDKRQTSKEWYPLVDFISRVYCELEEMQRYSIISKDIEFTEDYMPLLFKRDEKYLYLSFKYKPGELQFSFTEFKDAFIVEAKQLLLSLISAHGSEVLNSANYGYFKNLRSKLKI